MIAYKIKFKKYIHNPSIPFQNSVILRILKMPEFKSQPQKKYKGKEQISAIYVGKFSQRKRKEKMFKYISNKYVSAKMALKKTWPAHLGLFSFFNIYFLEPDTKSVVP